MSKYKYYSRNYQEKITQNAKTTISKPPQGKNMKTKNIKNPIIQTNDTFIIDYNEEENFKQNIPPKNPKKYNRRSLVDSFKNKKK